MRQGRGLVTTVARSGFESEFFEEGKKGMAGACRALSVEMQRCVERMRDERAYRAAYASGLGCGKTVASYEAYRQRIQQRFGLEMPSLAEMLAAEPYDERETNP